MIYIYRPAWIQPNRWNLPYHHDRYRWLGRELKLAAIRTTVLATLAWGVAWIAARSRDAKRRARWAAVLPLLVMADLLGSHWYDVATVDPRYWTEPPETVRRIKADPGFIRVVGVADKSSGEPGYASEEINFLGVRDPLDWSLPLAWHLPTSRGNTPMYSRRLFDFGDPTGTQHSLPWRLRPRGRHAHRRRPAHPGGAGREGRHGAAEAL